MITFTPGPWSVDPDKVGTSLYVAAPCNGLPDAVWYIADVMEGIDNGQGDEQQANARLIASAPELLSALQKMVYEFEGCYADGDPALISAKAAIAKATNQ